MEERGRSGFGTGPGRRWAPPAPALLGALAALIVLAGTFGDRVDARFGRLTQGTPAAGPPPDAEVPCAVPADPAVPRQTSDGTGPEEILASPTATPAAAAVQAALAAELETLARSLAACLSAGDHERVAALATTRYLGQAYGGGDPLTAEQYLALAGDLPTLRTVVRAFDDVRAEAPDRASADVLYVVANQLRHGRWSFVRELTSDPTGGPAAGGRWRVDAEEPLPVDAPPGAATVQVELDAGAFDLDPAEVTGPAVVLQGRNVDDRDHEMLLLRLDDGVTTDALLREPGPQLPAGIAFVGQATVPAGADAALALVDLAPGTYTLVCLLPDDNGIPDLAAGMEAELTVR